MCALGKFSGAFVGVWLWIAAGAPAFCAELKLSTVRIDLSDRQPSAALTLTNAGGQTTLVQFRVLAWSQATGEDALTPTRDIIANPPLAQIGPGARQLVRIGYLGQRQAPVEGSYRLVIEEVPIVDAAPTSGIRTNLKISMPVFIVGTEKSVRRLNAAWSRGAAGAPTLMIENRQTQHVLITKYSLTGSDQATKTFSGLYYILPGARVALPAAGVAGDPRSVVLTTPEGEVQLSLDPPKR